MGAINFSYCSLLPVTFGFNREHIEDEHHYEYLHEQVKSAVSDIESHIFNVKLYRGYYDGYVIQATAVDTYAFNKRDNLAFIVDVMQDCFIAHINHALKHKRVLKKYVKEAHSRAQAGVSSDQSNTKPEHQYLFDVVNHAAYCEEGFKYELDKYSKVMTDALDQMHIDFCHYDACNDDDMEALQDKLADAISKEVIANMVKDCIEGCLDSVFKQVYAIAKEFNLMSLTGYRWTSHLAEHDFNENEEV